MFFREFHIYFMSTVEYLIFLMRIEHESEISKYSDVPVKYLVRIILWERRFKFVQMKFL